MEIFIIIFSIASNFQDLPPELIKSTNASQINWYFFLVRTFVFEWIDIWKVKTFGVFLFFLLNNGDVKIKKIQVSQNSHIKHPNHKRQQCFVSSTTIFHLLDQIHSNTNIIIFYDSFVVNVVWKINSFSLRLHCFNKNV